MKQFANLFRVFANTLWHKLKFIADIQNILLINSLAAYFHQLDLFFGIGNQ